MLQPTGGVNTTTSHVHFRGVNFHKEFSYRLKVNKFGALTTIELVSRHTERHGRFLRDPVYRESQLAIGWTEQKCKEWDELAQEDHTYRLTPEQKKRYQGQWYLTLNKACKNGPMKLRSDFRAAVSMKKSSTPRTRRTSWGAFPSRSIQTMASLFKHIVVGLEMSS